MRKKICCHVPSVLAIPSSSRRQKGRFNSSSESFYPNKTNSYYKSYTRISKTEKHFDRKSVARTAKICQVSFAKLLEVEPRVSHGKARNGLSTAFMQPPLLYMFCRYLKEGGENVLNEFFANTAYSLSTNFNCSTMTIFSTNLTLMTVAEIWKTLCPTLVSF